MTRKQANPDVAIKPMRSKDAGVIAEMMKGLQAFHGDTSITTAGHFRTYCCGPNKMSHAWIAYVNDAPAGFVVFYDWINFVRAKKIRRLDLLFVKEEFRSNGVGNALITALIKDGQRQNVQRLDVSAGKKNKIANTFYKKLGFAKRDLYTQDYMMSEQAMGNIVKSKRSRGI